MISRRSRPGAPRDYIAEYKAMMASRRLDIVYPKGTKHWRLIYTKRMAKKQEEAARAGVPFVPQQARGHKPREHVSRRVNKIVAEQIRRAPQEAQRIRDLAKNDPNHLIRIENARNAAIRNANRPRPRRRDWDEYADDYDLESDDEQMFFYHGSVMGRYAA